MKRSNRLAALVLSAALIITMSGCQLAKEIRDSQDDQLVGVFLTTEHLEGMEDALDARIEEVLQHQAGLLQDGQTITLDDFDAGLLDRHYAELVKDPETGVQQYTFTALKGYPLFVSRVTDEDGQNYRTTSDDGGFCDVNLHLSVTDEGEGIQLSGTLYYVESAMESHPVTFVDEETGAETVENEVHFSVNPVYQQADGRVYVTSGDSFGMGDFSTTLNQKITTTVNGKTAAQESEITVHLSPVESAVGYRLLELDDGGDVVNKTELTPDHLPEAVTLLPQTAYLVVETQQKSSEGKPLATRKIVERDEETFTVLVPQEDGICEEQVIALH